MVKHTQIIRRQKPTNCLSMFDHLVGLELKGLNNVTCVPFHLPLLIPQFSNNITLTKTQNQSICSTLSLQVSKTNITGLIFLIVMIGQLCNLNWLIKLNSSNIRFWASTSLNYIHPVQKQTPEVFYEKMKTPMPSLYFNKVGLATLLKKTSLAQVLSCEFCEISKNTFLQNTSGRLLLPLAP